jgi:hypothetical protein
MHLCSGTVSTRTPLGIISYLCGTLEGLGGDRRLVLMIITIMLSNVTVSQILIQEWKKELAQSPACNEHAQP